MKILCVIDSLGAGGAQRQLVNLAVGFTKNGHQVSFLVYHYDSFYNEYLSSHGIEITHVIESNYFHRILKMRRHIRSRNYDSVLAFLSSACFIATIAGLPFRRWNLIVGERSANPNILTSYKLKFLKFFHVFADSVVANSSANLEIIRKVNPLLSKKKCYIIHNMVSIDSAKFVDYQNDKDCRKSIFKLIVVASQRNLKNLSGLVEAVNLMSNVEKNRLSIDWYGEQNLDSSQKKATERIHELGLQHIFKFYDPIPDIHGRMSQADAVGLFSQYEGFPNTICEALKLGKPVICTKVSDIPKLLKEDENGFFCMPNDYSSIEKAIRKCMNANISAIRKISTNNIQLADQLFDEVNVVNSYLNLLNNK